MTRDPESEQRGAIPPSEVGAAAAAQAHDALAEQQRGDGGERDRHAYKPRSFAITMRCTSFVPSPISRIFWSRYSREIGVLVHEAVAAVDLQRRVGDAWESRPE